MIAKLIIVKDGVERVTELIPKDEADKRLKSCIDANKIILKGMIDSIDDKLKEATNILDKLHWIDDNHCIYNIHYCKAGVGFCFYEGQAVTEVKADDNWRKDLHTYHYYDTFEKAVEAEYERLEGGGE